MTGKTFFNHLANGRMDIVQLLLSLLEQTHAAYCLIGGLAVNAYAEPVVSLDLDLVVIADRLDALRQAAVAKGLMVREFEHSVNLTAPGSDLRIQIQADPRYQDFLTRAVGQTVLGYSMNVAALEDVLRGKLWAYAAPTRRKSKRQKDLADILRLVETHPQLKSMLPPEIIRQVETP